MGSQPSPARHQSSGSTPRYLRYLSFLAASKRLRLVSKAAHTHAVCALALICILGLAYLLLQLKMEHAYRAVDIGPSADSPSAAEFRHFWVSKAEMRRFQVSLIASKLEMPMQFKPKTSAKNSR